VWCGGGILRAWAVAERGVDGDATSVVPTPATCAPCCISFGAHHPSPSFVHSRCSVLLRGRHVMIGLRVASRHDFLWGI
jgi:hypothetical protein